MSPEERLPLKIHLGDYLVQSVVHSLIALVVVEASLRIWGIERAKERFFYRLQILVLPLLVFPVSHWINPERNSLYFVLDTAIFSSARWLELQFGRVPLLLFALVGILLATSLLTLIQEVIPILRRLRSQSNEESDVIRLPQLEAQLAEPSRRLNIRPPSVFCLEEEGPFLFISGTREPAIFLSRDLLDHLDPAQLKAALVHELAHIARRSTATTLLVFFARMLMFYNPVSLLVFRRLLHLDEQVCDEMTVAMTQNPGALASALSQFRTESPSRATFSFSALRETVARDSHNLLLKERISSLQSRQQKPAAEKGWLPRLATAGAVIVLCYLVV